MNDILKSDQSIYIKQKMSTSKDSHQTNKIYKLNTDIRWSKKGKKKTPKYEAIELPSSYDSSVYKDSTSVVDQESCGCCFAISTSTCISDVFLFGLNMSFNPEISAMYILSSINLDSNKKCNGGNPYDTLEYIEKNGITTNVCVSYETACLNNSYCNGSTKDDSELSKMIPTKGCCNNKIVHYLYYIKNLSVESDINLIKTHIYKYGCAIGGFTVYQSFQIDAENRFSDTNGIYIDKGTDMNEKPTGYHAICIVGWGIQNGINYWVCRNSWGKDWGDNGYFKYAMYDKGINERNALEKVYHKDEGDIGGIILFEPNGAKRFDAELSNCIFLNELKENDKNVLKKYYDTNENDPKDKNGKTISEPILNESSSVYIYIIVISVIIIIILSIYNYSVI